MVPLNPPVVKAPVVKNPLTDPLIVWLAGVKVGAAEVP